MARKDVVGSTGEQLAVDYLLAEGYEIVERNWRCSVGELDIIAQLGRTTVVVEVKTRTGLGFGHPLDAITPRKLARLRRLAAAWCETHGAVTHLRIDAIGVIVGRSATSVEHVRQVC